MDEIVKIISSLGWPHIVLIFGVIFIIIFRAPIATFISRIKSVSKKGGINTTETTPEIQHEEKRKLAVEQLMKVGDSIVLNEVEDNIIKKLSADGLETDSDSTRVLIRHLAATQLLLDYEQIHSLIFGSQIVLLKRLNEVLGLGRIEAYVEDFFSNVNDMYPSITDWSKDEYLRYLFESNLITIQDGNYHITMKGIDYLGWIVRNGRREDLAL